MSDFRNLLVWQKAHALALHANRVATGIRATRYSALRSQITRAAMSIPANIAEGRRQTSDPQFARFLGYSIYSADELEYHLIVACDIGVITPADANSLRSELVEVRRMLYGLRNKISPGQKDLTKTKPIASSDGIDLAYNGVK